MVNSGDSVDPSPFVSVVLLASRHKEFVQEAISSVRRQTAPSSEFELVVVRDYDDPALDRAVEGIPGRSVQVGPGDIGPAIDAGVRSSRGEILAFLDDDDRFRPEKLATAIQSFRSDPKLGFYRNGFVVIDEAGRPLPNHRFRAEQRRAGERVGPRTLGGPDRGAALRTLPPLGLDFNSSCMVVRRDVLQSFMERIELKGFRLLDALVFFAALSSSRSLRIDPTVLTEYRIHSGNSSINSGAVADGLARRAEFSRRVAPGYERMTTAARATGSALAADEAAALQTVQSAYLAMREPGTPRQEFARLHRQLMDHRACYLVRSEPRLTAAIRLFSLSPSLGRWLYSRRIRSERS
jgi:Glycosyl transferase family 2